MYVCLCAVSIVQCVHKVCYAVVLVGPDLRNFLSVTSVL
jgi:hypothetical protein